METFANNDIGDILTSIHSRLTRLENQIGLGGRKHDEIFYYEFKSLKKLKTFIDERQWRMVQEQVSVPKRLNVSFPRIPVHSIVSDVFGTNGPIVEVKSEVNEGDKYGLVCVKATPRDNTFKYVIEYTVNRPSSSSEKQSSRSVPQLESVKCRNEEQVVETLESIMFPDH
jgi:hypothetical protein